MNSGAMLVKIDPLLVVFSQNALVRLGGCKSLISVATH